VNKNLRNHLGFQVDDLAAARKRFEEAGVEVEEAEAAYSEERGFHQDRFFVRDPGGNRLEILEPRRPYSSAH
jgi:catechol 2,3-dioxygenase-like lactoylglutathione lyase family enzyme